jgi:NodT family efflux transporter outer membrane factor (OMF) lipoprotein
MLDGFHHPAFTRCLWLASSMAVLAALIAGCRPRSAPVVVPVTVPGGFSQTGTEALPERFWRALGDPELDALVERALAGNLTLRAAWARLDQVRALAVKAGVGRYPVVQGEADASGTLAKSGNSFTASIGVAASYEVDLWGRVRSTRDAARIDVLASRETLQAAAISLAAEVAVAWFQQVERAAQLELLRRQIAVNEQVHELVMARFQKAQGAAADVLSQRQLLESLRGEQAQAVATQRTYHHQLAVLLARPPGDRVAPSRSAFHPLPPLPRVGVPSELLQRRPDVRAAFHQVQAADRRVAAALADRYPKLSLTAAVSLSGGYNRVQFWSWLANLGANLLAPLFDAGQRKAEVERTRAVAREALGTYGQTVLTALREVEDALVKESGLLAQRASQERQRALATMVIEQTRASYAGGVESYLRVLDALLRHQTLERSLVALERDLRVNRVALCRALAGSWHLERPSEPRPTALILPERQSP